MSLALRNNLREAWQVDVGVRAKGSDPRTLLSSIMIRLPNILWFFEGKIIFNKAYSVNFYHVLVQ